MNKPIGFTLPGRQSKREHIFAIRLTEAERGQIEALAQRLKLPDSFMAHHSAEQVEDVELECQTTGAE